jgi:two-component system chemotaxis sensor kinase CheA
MEMDISQYKDLFITESQEHLDALNKFLLQLENEPDNLDVVTEIFRSAHTLKGMSATMGYDRLTELAHEMENLLEHLRTGDTPVTTSIVDMLFSCFDTLGALINAIAEDRPGDVDFSGLVTEMRMAAEGAAVTPEQAARPGTSRPEPAETAPTTVEDTVPEGRGEAPELELDPQELTLYEAAPGMGVLKLTVELDRECLLKSVRVFMVFKKLAQLGEVIASQPPVEALEDEKFESTFQVAVASTESPDRIRKALLAIAEISGVGVETLVAPREGEEPEHGTVRQAGEKVPMQAARKTQSVRVNIARLDTLMNLVGELVINRTRLAQIASSLEVPELREALDHTARLTGELQDEVMKTRMVPVEQVFNRFPRMVRDLAREQDKEIDFDMEGKEIELDRTILDEISDPLIHMLRNAVDHGIDTPRVRLKEGKPGRGTIKLSAYRDRNYVAIAVEDDGGGIDAQMVFDQACARGVVTDEEKRQLTKEDLLRILCTPGFSTSETVSGVSGRGVGMDAVKFKAESLGGFVVLESEPGEGTRIILNLPLTLAIVQALMVEVSDELYAVPLGTVRETYVVNTEDIKTVQNSEAIFLRDEVIPLLRLDRVLECGHQLNDSQPFPVVITEIGPRLIALGVHSLIGQQEIVISTLDEFLKRIEGFAGATILGTGRVALILDIPSLA